LNCIHGAAFGATNLAQGGDATNTSAHVKTKREAILMITAMETFIAVLALLSYCLPFCFVSVIVIVSTYKAPLHQDWSDT